MPDDIEIIGRAIHSAVCDGEHDRLTDDDEAAARAVLTALSAAGRLLPEGGQTRTEWGVRSTGDYAVDCTDADEAHRWAARDVRILCERGRDATLIRRSVQEWPDGSTLTGPWVAVDQEATDG